MKKKSLVIITVVLIIVCGVVYATITSNAPLKVKIRKIAITSLVNSMKAKCHNTKDMESAGWMVIPEASCLMKFGDSAAPYLIEAFEDKSNGPIFRWLLIDLIKFTHDKKAEIPLIEALLDKNEDINVRRTAAGAIASYNDGKKSIEALTSALNEDDYLLKVRALESLGRIGNKEIAQSVMPLLNDKNELVRRTAIQTLAQIGDEHAYEYLVPLLNDTEWTVRSWCAKALGDLKDARAIEPLRGALKDEHEFVRQDAMIALGKLGDEQAFNMLIGALNTTSFGEQNDIVEALGNIGNKEAIGSLKEELKIKRTGLGRGTTALIALSLAKLGCRDGYNVALECLKYGDWETRVSAVRALGEIGDEASIKVLRSLLNDKDIMTQSEAKAVLNKIQKR